MGISGLTTWLKDHSELIHKLNLSPNSNPTPSNQDTIIFDSYELFYQLAKGRDYFYDFSAMYPRAKQFIKALRACGLTNILFVVDDVTTWMNTDKFKRKIVGARKHYARIFSRMVACLYLCTCPQLACMTE